MAMEFSKRGLYFSEREQLLKDVGEWEVLWEVQRTSQDRGSFLRVEIGIAGKNVKQ